MRDLAQPRGGVVFKLAQAVAGEVAGTVQAVADGGDDVADGAEHAAGVGGLRQQALGEAQQAVAGAFDVQVLAGGFLEVGAVKVAVRPEAWHIRRDGAGLAAKLVKAA